MPHSLDDIPLMIVTTLEQLQQLKTELMNVKEFAVDMEVRIACIIKMVMIKYGMCTHRYTICNKFLIICLYINVITVLALIIRTAKNNY